MDIATAAVLDIETTGLSPRLHETIELSMIKFSFQTATGEVVQEIEELHALNEPSGPLPPFIKKLTGITEEMLAEKSFDLSHIRTYCQDIDYFIAHNASFDRSFLIELLPELAEKNWYCSMRNIQWKKYGLPNKKLQTLLDAHGIQNIHSHRAASDTRSTFELLKRRNPDHQPYLLELLSKKPMRKPRQDTKPYIVNNKSIHFDR